MTKCRDINEVRIDEQKKFFKDSKDSPCRKCENYNRDCFEYFKMLGRDAKTGFSTVEKCGGFKEGAK